MIKVMIADDSDIALDGMRRILERESDIEVVCQGTTKYEAVEQALAYKPDILLLDLMWFNDKEAGIDVIKRLTRELPETQIVAITVYPHLIDRARAAGARSAVSKNIPRRQLIEEIRGIYRVPPAEEAAPEDYGYQRPTETLTGRELEVLALVAEGLTDREVAQRLHIAPTTARNHVSNIMGKLGVSSRTAAATKAIREELLDEDDD